MTPEITIRTFTDDQYVLDKIFYANNYRLKTFPEDKPITIVDVGAHTGYFSLLCLLRGAHAVYSVEPFSDNFRILIGNLEAFNERLTALKMGVYTESKFANITYPEPENSFFYLSHINFHDGVSKGPREMASFCTLDNFSFYSFVFFFDCFIFINYFFNFPYINWLIGQRYFYKKTKN